MSCSPPPPTFSWTVTLSLSPFPGRYLFYHSLFISGPIHCQFCCLPPRSCVLSPSDSRYPCGFCAIGGVPACFSLSLFVSPFYDPSPFLLVFNSFLGLRGFLKASGFLETTWVLLCLSLSLLFPYSLPLNKTPHVCSICMACLSLTHCESPWHAKVPLLPRTFSRRNISLVPFDSAGSPGISSCAPAVRINRTL